MSPTSHPVHLPHLRSHHAPGLPAPHSYATPSSERVGHHVHHTALGVMIIALLALLLSVLLHGHKPVLQPETNATPAAAQLAA